MTADEMFEELGYKRKDNIYYNEYCYIRFDNYNVSKYDEYKDPYLGWCEFSIPITMKELQAINKKVEELKWN